MSVYYHVAIADNYTDTKFFNRKFYYIFLNNPILIKMEQSVH